MIELIKQFFNAILNLFSKKENAENPKTTNKTTDTKPVIENKPTLENKPKDNITPKPNNNMIETKKNLYSLIVGINEYKFVTKLGGCVNDANRINDYLKKVTDNSEVDYHPLVLTNAAATKENIQNGFLEHLTKAGKDDIVVYYFSGHGAQERGDEVWKKTEADGGLETQVCVDSRDDNGTPDLADKELRYLIHQVSLKNPHILVISDSCHSGDNTRTGMVKRRLPDESEVGEARLSNLAPMRKWEKFIFADKISKEEIANANELSSILPEGHHIQMAACKDRELAYELRGSGIFTSMLLNVLERSNGDISYGDLRQRIRHSITGKYPQVPQIYASSGDATELHQTFLGGASVKEPFYYNVQKNFRTSIGWTLSIGAIHGMPTNTDADIEIEIRDTNDKSKILTTATVKKVEPGMTKLAIDDESKLEAQGQYFATIPKLFTEPLRMYIHGDEEGINVLKDRINKDKDFKYSNLAVTDDLVLADYLVYARKGEEKDYYFIGHPMNDLSKIEDTYEVTFPNDDIPTNLFYWKWLTEQQEGFIPGAANQIINFMKTASNWHFLKKLENPNTQLTNHNVEVIINHLPKKDFQKKKRVEFDDGLVELRFDPGSNPPTIWFTVELKNNSDRTYRVAAPTLFNGFEVYTDSMTNGVTELKPGETKQAFGGNAISIELLDRMEDGSKNWWIKEFNWPHKSWWLKLIVSTEEFSIRDFASKAVPYPVPDRDLGEPKGFGNIGQINQPIITSDWTTELFEIRIKNPFHVKPPEEIIK